MAKAVRVEEHSFQRIAQVTRHVERANRGTTGPAAPPDGDGGIWHSFLNTYAGEIPAHAVVEIDDVIPLEQTVGGVYKATRPGTTFGAPYAINGPQAVPENGTGFLRFSGQAVCAYDTGGTPAAKEGWGVKPDSFLLWNGYPSICLVHKIVDTDAKLLLGTLGEVRTLLCLTTGTIGPAATSSGFTVQSGDPSSNANTGLTPPTVHLGMTIDSGKLFIAHWLNNCWVGMPWECNDE